MEQRTASDATQLIDFECLANLRFSLRISLLVLQIPSAIDKYGRQLPAFWAIKLSPEYDCFLKVWLRFFWQFEATIGTANGRVDVRLSFWLACQLTAQSGGKVIEQLAHFIGGPLRVGCIGGA